MPNTNPSDLDREALFAAMEVRPPEDFEPYDRYAIRFLVAYLKALPRASGVPEAEAGPVAWRYKPRIDGEWEWKYSARPWRELWNEKWVGEPLFTAPPPVAAPSGWRLVPVEPTSAMKNAAIDVDSFKLGDISPLGFRMSPQKLFAQCYAAMLAAAPPSPIESEPKDARSGEGQNMTAQELTEQQQANVIYEAAHRIGAGIGTTPRTMIMALRQDGYHIVRITRTAPSGAKP